MSLEIRDSKFLVCVLSFTDRVKYLVEGLDSFTTLSYPKFIKFIDNNFFILDKGGFIKELNSFQTIYLDNSTGKFEVLNDLKKDKIFNANFDELIKIREENEELEKNSKNNLFWSNRIDIKSIRTNIMNFGKNKNVKSNPFKFKR